MKELSIEEYAVKHPKTKPSTILLETWEIIDKLPKSAKILDIGCASGHGLNLVRKKYGDKYELYGIDLSTTRIKEAKKNYPKINFQVASAQDLPYSTSTFDVVLSSQVIEHVPDDNAMVAEIKRVLKKGGYFQVDTVIRKKFGWYFYRAPMGWGLDPTHVREYASKKELISMFNKNMLEVKLVKLVPVRRSLSILKLFRMLGINTKIRIPRYFTIFVIGKNE